MRFHATFLRHCRPVLCCTSSLHRRQLSALITLVTQEEQALAQIGSLDARQLPAARAPLHQGEPAACLRFLADDVSWLADRLLWLQIGQLFATRADLLPAEATEVNSMAGCLSRQGCLLPVWLL